MSSHSSEAPAHAGQDSDHHHGGDFLSHAKPYILVGGVLFLFTVITVALSYFDFGSTSINVAVGMAVATFKVCLVAAIFMHLKGESATVWRPLLFTLFFTLGLFVLTLLAFYDPIFSTIHAHH